MTTPHQRIGLALHAIGHAAGRSEGEAERLRLADEVANLRLVCSWDPTNPLDLAEARATIARLTAELAEARAAHDEALATTDRIVRKACEDVAAARVDGAREEREACALALTTLRNGSDLRATERIIAFDEAVDAIRARSEGQGPAIAREPAPTANGNRAIWPLLIAETAAGHYGGDTPEKRHLLADMAARHTYGVEHYGTPLQAHNGRDALVDAYQEALDLPVYLRQAQEEGKLPRSNGLVSNAVHLALCIRMHLDVRETEGRGEGQGS